MMGDLSENGDYQAAKEAQGLMEERILYLSRMLADAVIIDVGAEGARRGSRFDRSQCSTRATMSRSACSSARSKSAPTTQ